MITKAQLNEMLRNDNYQRQIIFKQNFGVDGDDIEPLDTCKGILKNKPQGYWLIRESRKDGMISVSLKKKRGIHHTRFAVVLDQWIVVPHKNLDLINNAHSFNRLTKNTIGKKFKQLITLLVNSGYFIPSLILPGINQSTTSQAYLSYCVAVDNTLCFNSPMLALKAIKELLKQQSINFGHASALNYTGLEKMTPNLSSEEQKDLFTAWLEQNKLDMDLYCPISLELYTQPYVLEESGFVIDKSSLFDEQGKKKIEKCPFTSALIQRPPYRMAGYIDLLQKCLDLFSKLANLYNKQRESSEEKIHEVTSQVVPFTLFFQGGTAVDRGDIASPVDRPK